MRYLFVCSSLERGRDGVGDYTRLLAEEFRQHSECAMIALHDRHLKRSAFFTKGQFPELRLPIEMPWAERVLKAVAFRESFQPDWISLQFVPYGFDDRGFIWQFARHLRPILWKTPLHLMFHELWIGANTSASVKERLIGAVQRRLILRMLQQLAPKVVSTSNGVYVAMLEQAGIAASRLSLFGNIPIADPDDEWLFSALSGHRVGLTAATRAKFWIFGIFGGLHAEWPPEPLFTRLREAARRCGKRVLIASIGRLGAAGERLWEELKCAHGKNFEFMKFGEQPTKRVSEFLLWLDFGIANSPWALIEKSGSAAAMLDHGLPVIVNRFNWQARSVTPAVPRCDPLLYQLDASLETKLSGGLPKRKALSSLPKVVSELVETLREVTS